MDHKEVWFITGASTGLGHHLMKGLLQNGHQVAAVARDKDSLQGLIGRYLADDRRAGSNGKTEVGWQAEDLLCLSADLTNEDSVQQAIQQTIHQFGRIDKVVNYAGCDLYTPVEGLSENVLHHLFEDSVFGTFHVLRQVMPYLKSQRSGIILTYSSPAAIAAAAGSPLYAATKLAIEHLSEELTAGIEALGIQQTIVGPGPGVFAPTPTALHESRSIRQEDYNPCGGLYEKAFQRSAHWA